MDNALATALKLAIQRDNVERDGKIWSYGSKVAATPENVAANIADAQKRLDERRELLAKLRQARSVFRWGPKEEVNAVRRMLPADTGIASFDEAIQCYESLVRESETYIQDMTIAGQCFAAASIHKKAASC